MISAPTRPDWDALETRKGWIFSARTDLLVFWLPVFAAYFFQIIFRGRQPDQIEQMNFVLGLAIFDAGHVLSTAGPVYRRHLEGKVSRLMKGFFVVSALLIASYAYSRQLFFAIVAPFAVYHVMKQQYGWLMYSRRKFGEPAQEGRKWDQLLIWTLLLVPVLWWLSPMSAAEKYYYMRGDFVFTIPAAVAQVALGFYGIVIAAYAVHVARLQRPVNWAKISLLAATGFWFFSLVLFPSKGIFFASLFYVHGVSYVLHARREFSNTPFHRLAHQPRPGVVWLATRVAPFFLIVFGLGAIWRFSGTIYFDLFARDGRGSPWEFLMWYPLMTHYYFDSFIWRGLELPVGTETALAA
jgi:hypothetical protein